MAGQVDTSVVTVKGQIVIPSRIRHKLGLKQGTRVCLVDHGDEIVVRALTKDYFNNMAGFLNTAGKLSKRLLEERAADKERENKR